jgi:hypothetical protein
MDLTICVFTLQFLDGNEGDVLAVILKYQTILHHQHYLYLNYSFLAVLIMQKQHDTPEYQR